MNDLNKHMNLNIILKYWNWKIAKEIVSKTYINIILHVLHFLQLHTVFFASTFLSVNF